MPNSTKPSKTLSAVASKLLYDVKTLEVQTKQQTLRMKGPAELFLT